MQTKVTIPDIKDFQKAEKKKWVRQEQKKAKGAFKTTVIPFLDHQMEKIYTADNIHHWQDCVRSTGKLLAGGNAKWYKAHTGEGDGILQNYIYI